jgi:hypothetical protein
LAFLAALLQIAATVRADVSTSKLQVHVRIFIQRKACVNYAFPLILYFSLLTLFVVYHIPFLVCHFLDFFLDQCI